MCHNIIDDFPEKYDNYDGDLQMGTTVDLSGILTLALEREMYTAVLDYSAHFKGDYSAHFDFNLMRRVVWKLIARNPSVVLPKSIRNLSISYESNESWGKKRNLALVLLRAYKNTTFADILGCIASYMHSLLLDNNAAKRDLASFPMVADSSMYDSDGDSYY